MILIAYGTRPEWLKVKPVIEELKKNNLQFLTLFTGQHEDLVEGLDARFRLNIVDRQFSHIDRLNLVLSEVIAHTSTLLNILTEIKYVLVQGDTTSALGVALAAFNCKRKIIHLEAGLRTYDLDSPFPEEGNRQIISRITDIHFCPTEHNFINLMNEGRIPEKYVVGNTALDNLLPYKGKCEYRDKVLITMHRRENHEKIEKWFHAFNDLALSYPNTEFILPIHPNPNVQRHRDILKKVKVVDPLPHEKLLDILVKCKLVITDSGGLQEEASFFNKKVLVCRRETERPEALEKTSFMIDDPTTLNFLYAFHVIERSPAVLYQECPFGDGKSAEKIVEILKDIVYEVD
jgi:UDP-N-acetylglucosamine 2-epimerase (non-hydrolysing)